MARVAFCQDELIEYMGFMCMSAVLKQAGHTVELFIDAFNNEQKFLADLERFRPDIVGFSILTPSAKWGLNRARKIKSRMKCLTVFGNVHAMVCPEIIENDGVDIVCLGEGEFCMLELCEAIDQGKDYTHIHGFWVKTAEGIVKNPMRQELVDMDKAPFVDREIYNKYMYFRHSNQLRVLAGRGCPFRCHFCSNPLLVNHYGGFNKYGRKRSPELAIREIEHLIRQHPTKVKYVYFVDEVLWVKNEWLREFLRLYKERIGIPFFANFRFGAIQEEDIKLLAEAGPKVVYVATETGDEYIRRKVMNKPVTNEQVIQIADWMHKYKVPFGCSNLFGITPRTAEEYIAELPFYRRVKPFYIWTAFFQPYPGLELTRRMAEYIPQDREFDFSYHARMYLNLPDYDRLVNLKKVYFLIYRFPWTEKIFRKLINYNIPFLFDFLFALHFTYCVLKVDQLTLTQYALLCLTKRNPFLPKRRPPRYTGRPFILPWRKKLVRMVSASATEERRAS